MQKQLAGEHAAAYVQDGMTVGLGTGSTVYWTIRKLGERVQNGLSIRGVPTSEQTRLLALELGIPIVPLPDSGLLDLTIDGADEISADLQLIKGGGGALLREKLVAAASRKLIVVADASKLSERLGAFPLPVEIIPFGWEQTAGRIAGTGTIPRLREKDGQPFVTDNGNYIVDCKFSSIIDPAALHEELKRLTGVVDTGLFINMADTVIVGTDEGVCVMGTPAGDTDV